LPTLFVIILKYREKYYFVIEKIDNKLKLKGNISSHFASLIKQTLQQCPDYKIIIKDQKLK